MTPDEAVRNRLSVKVVVFCFLMLGSIALSVLSTWLTFHSNFSFLDYLSLVVWLPALYMAARLLLTPKANFAVWEGELNWSKSIWARVTGTRTIKRMVIVTLLGPWIVTILAFFAVAAADKGLAISLSNSLIANVLAALFAATPAAQFLKLFIDQPQRLRNVKFVELMNWP